MTDAATAAYAVGDIDDLKSVFEENLNVENVYSPIPENTRRYQKICEIQTRLVRDDMSQAFRTMKEINA